MWGVGKHSHDEKKGLADRIRRWVQGVLEDLDNALNPKQPIPIPVPIPVPVPVPVRRPTRRR